MPVIQAFGKWRWSIRIQSYPWLRKASLGYLRPGTKSKQPPPAFARHTTPQHSIPQDSTPQHSTPQHGTPSKGRPIFFITPPGSLGSPCEVHWSLHRGEPWRPAVCSFSPQSLPAGPANLVPNPSWKYPICILPQSLPGLLFGFQQLAVAVLALSPQPQQTQMSKLQDLGF